MQAQVQAQIANANAQAKLNQQAQALATQQQSGWIKIALIGGGALVVLGIIIAIIRK